MSLPRQDLLRIYQAALRAVDGRRVTADYCARAAAPQACALLALGKAAPHMAAGALDVLGGAVRQTLIVTKRGVPFTTFPAGRLVQRVESSHPVPDESSLAAGRTVMDFLRGLPAELPLLVLLSGGTSALLELPAPDLSLDDLHRAGRWLLASGLDIQAVNAVRKRLSAVKDGRLAGYLKKRPTTVLLISDVPGDDPTLIGSGPFAPPAAQELPDGLPAWLLALTKKSAPPPRAGDFANIHLHIVADAAKARRAAAEEARRLAYNVEVYPELLQGDAPRRGRELARTLRRAAPGIYIYSAETTVLLPPRPGRGGRCQSLALAAALDLAGTEGLYLLAAGSDGDDGPYGDAGAVVDGGTVMRGELNGRNAARDLSAADAGRFLETSGDLINGRATGTNVMDLLLALRCYTASRNKPHI